MQAFYVRVGKGELLCLMPLMLLMWSLLLQVADLMAFVASASSLCEDSDSYYIDSFGNQCLSVFRSLGLPSSVVFIRVRHSAMTERNVVSE